MNDHLPEWYQEIMKGIKPKKLLSPEKKTIINYLKEQIRNIEEGD